MSAKLDTIASPGAVGTPDAAAPDLVRSGIEPLDDRIGGLREGGTYLLAGLPGSGRFVAVLQFLSEGLKDGRVGLLTAAPRGRVFEEARHWGFDLEGAWRGGRLSLLSYRSDFQRHLLSAADPSEVFGEMERLLGPDVRRLGLYPGTPLWETRAGTSIASQVCTWLGSYGATTLGVVGGDLEGARTPASDWVVDAATGVFLLERLPIGVRQLWVRRMTPPLEESGPVTLELAPGKGYVKPTGALDRRRTDRNPEAERRVLMIRLSSDVPDELQAWLDRWYRTTTVEAPFEAVELAQQQEFGLILIYPSRDRVSEAVQAVRALRGFASAPIILASDDQVRAADRVRAIEAGASDFVSGPLNVGELASRAERAVISRAPSPEPARTEERAGSRERASRPMTGREFAATVRSRLRSERGSLLSFLKIVPPGSPKERARLTQILADEIRDEDDDLMQELPGMIAVVLQGTETEKARAFLTRVRRQMGDEAADLHVRVLSGTVDAPRINELLEGIRA
jgi:DNA-binding response OmpR family regulator